MKQRKIKLLSKIAFNYKNENLYTQTNYAEPLLSRVREYSVFKTDWLVLIWSLKSYKRGNIFNKSGFDRVNERKETQNLNERTHYAYITLK